MALIRRPKFSIRLRIALGFLVTFIIACGITIGAMMFISELGKKQRFLERAGNYAYEIQQARRFEKNYFLYGTDLYDALSHVHTAQEILTSNRRDFLEIIGEHAYRKITSDLQRYNDLLEQLREADLKGVPLTGDEKYRLESELRRFGAEILADASNTIDQERLRINSLMYTSKVIAVAALLIILVLEAVIASFITRQIIRPFRRFEKYTQRIAAGDFSPITPARKYRDEFTNLAIAINRMLTELKHHEEQLIQSRKMAAIGSLTAGIAHELNNPLNNISLTSEALIEDFDSWTREEKLKMLRDIFTQVERASVTVGNLLDFTRRDETSFERISVNDVLRSTAGLMSNELALNKVKLDLKLADNLPPILGNHHNLQQVFLNLFLNAIQAMPDGGILTVRSRVTDETVQVEVTDTGCGIPKDHLAKIFDPFFTTKEVGKGTGLGLSVSYGIIQKHHGSISVESEPGKGTTFTVRIPIAKGETV